jgi:hypothetical protein
MITIELANSAAGGDYISAGFVCFDAGHWSSGKGYPADADIPTVVAELKARIEHGPYERPESERIAACKAWALAHPDEYRKWADDYPEEYQRWLKEAA